VPRIRLNDKVFMAILVFRFRIINAGFEVQGTGKFKVGRNILFSPFK